MTKRNKNVINYTEDTDLAAKKHEGIDFSRQERSFLRLWDTRRQTNAGMLLSLVDEGRISREEAVALGTWLYLGKPEDPAPVVV